MARVADARARRRHSRLALRRRALIDELLRHPCMKTYAAKSEGWPVFHLDPTVETLLHRPLPDDKDGRRLVDVRQKPARRLTAVVSAVTSTLRGVIVAQGLQLQSSFSSSRPRRASRMNQKADRHRQRSLFPAETEHVLRTAVPRSQAAIEGYGGRWRTFAPHRAEWRRGLAIWGSCRTRGRSGASHRSALRRG